MPRTTRSQADKFYAAFSRLVRGYQYRDRSRAGSFGISAADWYPLELLVEDGPLTMTALARSLHLDQSSVTRVVDRLVTAGHASRERGTEDRRVWFVTATRSGERLVREIQATLTAEFRGILDHIDPGARRGVVHAIELLWEQFQAREAADAAATDRA